jgi:integrase
VGGSIVQRGPRKWLVRVWLGHDQNGKQQFHNKVVHGTRHDAEAYAADKISERNRGALPPTVPITLGEYLADWLENVARPRLRQSSYTSYVQVLDLYVPEDLLRRRLQNVTMADLEALYASLRRRGLSSRTVRYLHSVLRTALRHARIRRRIIVHDPTEGAQLPRQESKEMRALTWVEARKLVEVLRAEPVAGLLMEVMLVLGLRPSEAAGLRIGDLDLADGTLTIARRIVQLRGGGIDIGPPKSRRSARTLAIPRFLVARLGDHLNAVKARMARDAEWNASRLLFPSTRGRPINMHNFVKRHLKPAAARAGLPADFRLYDLRHSNATLSANGGAPLQVVANQLGHANPSVTANTYLHATADSARQVAGIFERRLDGRVSRLVREQWPDVEQDVPLLSSGDVHPESAPVQGATDGFDVAGRF